MTLRHRPRAHFRVVAALGNPLARFVVEFQRDIVVAELGFEFDDELVDDPLNRIDFKSGAN